VKGAKWNSRCVADSRSPSKIKRLLNDWSLRKISLLGKMTVIKALPFPILVQCFTVLPNLPDHIIKQLQDIFFSFLWDEKIDIK
jgi:hypothetical protein